jgi:sigma-B regulation protein RsbU (phosphoserine phosphatase)
MIVLSIPSAEKHKKWFLQAGVYTIGRSSQCDLVIEDETVSRRHAQIEIVDEDRIHLTDLGSHNGTTVNGRRISGQVQVTCEDVLAFGGVEARLLRDVPCSVPESLVNITDSMENPAHLTRLPIREALKPLSSKILEDPRLFSSFSELGKMLILPGPEENMFGKALELLKDILPVQRVAIFSIRKGGKEIGLAACRTMSQRESLSFNLSRTIADELLTQKNAVLISDTQHDRKFAEQKSIVESNIRSAIAVPLFDEGEMAGILYADTTDPAQRYNEDCLRIAATFGNILAAKIANCHLLRERQVKEILEAELAVASQIQKQLLPSAFPFIDGYAFRAFQVQCKQVGGDLYDIVQLSDGRIVFLVADVSGKGMGAALLASDILASFRIMYSAKDFGLLDAVCRVSKQLLIFSRPGDFATLFAGELHPDRHVLHYVNAGHNPPLLIRGKGDTEYLQSSGIPIGMLDLDTWKEETVELRPGDYLFVYTDGIPEAMNGQGEQFGDERLAKSILKHRNQSPEELTETMMGEVTQFIGDIPRSDDITMLALHRQP